MNKEYIAKNSWHKSYVRKHGTNTSYIIPELVDVEYRWDDAGRIQNEKERREAKKLLEYEREKIILSAQLLGGGLLLPSRISLDRNSTAKIVNSGRGTFKREAQMKATFTAIEQSRYKRHKPFRVSTSVWSIEDHRYIYYGTVGINLEEGMPPKDSGDLIVFHTVDWETVDVYVFFGFATNNKIENLDEVVAYVEETI